MDAVSTGAVRLRRRVRIDRDERRRLQWWCAAAAAAIAIAAAYVAAVPFDFVPPPPDRLLSDYLLGEALRANLIVLPNFLANIVLFMPIGFFGTGSFVDERSRLRSWAAACVLVIGASIAWSVAIETMQVLLPGRMSSLADVVAQTMGTAIGVAGWAFLAREVRTFVSSFAAGGRRALEGGLAVYGVIRGLLLLQPFDVTVDVGAIVAKIRAGAIVLNPLRSPAIDWRLLPSILADVVMAAPIGVLAAIAGQPRGVRRPAGTAIALGAAFFAAGELAQVFVRSRTADVVDLLANCAGVVAGVLVTSAVVAPAQSSAAGAWRRRTLEAGIALTLLLYAVYNLTPFDFVLSRELVESRIGRLTGVPFAGYYQNQEFKALGDFFTKVALTIPLGILFQLRFRPETTAYRRALTAGWLSFVGACLLAVEMGQLLLPTRYPENTDVLIGIAAVWVGMRVTRPFSSQVQT